MLRKIIRITDIILVFFMIIYALLFCIPGFIGYKPVNVLSGSMEPEIKTGSTAYIRKAEITDIHENDVIAFKLENEHMVLHRVKSIDSKSEITTKGDANENEDFVKVSESQLIGRMEFHIPYAGILYKCLTNPAVLVLILTYIGIRIGYKIGNQNKDDLNELEESIEKYRI